MSVSLLVFSGWIYRVHLIQSSLPYLLKDILTQAGVDVFQVELNDISIDGASIKSLSFEVDIADGDAIKKTRKETIKLSLHDIELKYQYQSLLQGRLDKVLIGQVDVFAVDSTPLNASSSIETSRQVKSSANKKNKTSLVLFKENINKFRNNWHSLIPLDALTVAEINFQGTLFGALDNHQFELLFHTDDDTMHVDLVGGTVNDLHAIKISSHVKDEWLFSVGQSKTALLTLHLMDESIAADYFFNAEKMTVFLKENNVASIDAVEVAGLFNGELKFYYNESGSVKNQTFSSFGVHGNKLNVSGNDMDDTQLSNLDINLNFQYKWLTDYKELVIGEKSSISFNQFDYANTKLINTPLNLSGVLQIKSDKWFYDGDLTVSELTLKQKMPKKKMPKKKTPKQKKSETEISETEISRQSQEVAFKNVSANIIADNEQLKVSGKFEPAVVPALISYKLNHQIVSGEGRLLLHTDEPFNLSNEKSISQLLKPWVYPFDVFSGEVDVDADLQWSKTESLQLTAKTRLKNVGGVFNELVFSGLNTKQNLTLLPAVETMSLSEKSRIGQTGLIRLDHIDSGVLISDLNFQLALRKPEKGTLPVLDVYNFNAELLGGHFSSQRFTLDFNRPVNNLLVHVSKLDLSRVSQMQQFSGLEIEGLLDGQLPIDINGEGVFVHEGYFYNNDRPGVIRYQPKTGVNQIAANPLSKIVLKALRDFRYDKLKAKLSYEPDGTLSIGLEMNGVSPELDNGRQVNLNINTEQNLKSLLKSIRFSEGLSDNIDKRVRQKYSATQ